MRLMVQLPIRAPDEGEEVRFIAIRDDGSYEDLHITTTREELVAAMEPLRAYVAYGNYEGGMVGALYERRRMLLATLASAQADGRLPGGLGVPVPGTARYDRAVRVLYGGGYDDLTAAEARALIDSDRPLDRPPERDQ